MPPEFTESETELSHEACEEILRDRGTGVLSLASGDEAYAVPISFGYAGETETVYVSFLGYSADSEKVAFAEDTSRASLVTYDVRGKFDWTSVVVRGPIREIDDDEWDGLVDAIEDNAWYPSLFSTSDPQGKLRGFALTVEELSGLEDDSGA
ncbi:pyridoxamine 5'-phosphate oxidase family protein [Natrialbaceae archaeon AArc-T1-2]|uniref:pyridoxamine 5'-phosphate oxidase family protein n=1 Tax=Natrialbaceae archaeon AArc-T1-2 TaxID=3053904 RepID=UPI00255A9F77|nr:pyridoxamine 5'-phosphate oxidase family protein [Natrialbaceae archaeon AArc-T1-2]WIV65810.1 pyridoxamine 5'-phosphate oxidase family protein [Natrialbaceae archaeon AArc-T1-2]